MNNVSTKRKLIWIENYHIYDASTDEISLGSLQERYTWESIRCELFAVKLFRWWAHFQNVNSMQMFVWISCLWILSCDYCKMNAMESHNSEGKKIQWLSYKITAKIMFQKLLYIQTTFCVIRNLLMCIFL